ncbi:MAG: hypothetical protein JXA74_10570 [Anaerolineae bacterium]|nr:hypothetical protein [Anaerolineae bacterium]
MAGLIGLFFAEVLFAGRAYYPGDIARLYLPQGTLLSESLHAGRVPWWTSSMGAGYPLLAEGEAGALYPVYWALYALLPPGLALSLGIVLHYLIAGIGFYVFLRELRLSAGAAYLGACAFALGGVMVAHLSHPSIIAVMAWIPWLFYASWRLATSPSLRRAAPFALLLAMVIGLQFLAGHAQISLLSLSATALFVLASRWLGPRTQLRTGAVWGLAAGALALGVLVGAPQLVASGELGQLSQRAGGLSGEFFTSYSFHPLLSATLVAPFALGNPYPEGSIEFMLYIGVLPLVLARLAIGRADRRLTGFFAALALAGLALALGRWNPLYRWLRHVPVVNLFRVPARYLLWTSFGLATLAGLGADALAKSSPRQSTAIGRGLAAAVLLVLAGLLGLMLAQPDTQALIDVWQWAPLVLALASAGACLAVRQLSRRVWLTLGCLVVCGDLYAYGLVLDRTYNATWQLDAIQTPPHSLAFLREQGGLFRIYTKEEILPDLTVMRESLYPNLAAHHGIQAANLYAPLIPQNYAAYVDHLTPARLNRLNVAYYLIPQLLPVDEASELYDVLNPFGALPVGRWLRLPPQALAAIEVESYLSHAASLRDGHLTAEIELRGDTGTRILPLRAGIESAEWAYERDDVRAQIAHALPEIASTWPARSGFPPRSHPGHTYRAIYRLEEPTSYDALRLVAHRPEAFVRIERIWLHCHSGERTLLNHLVGLGDHEIVYRSEDVLIYRNRDAFPRAYALSADRVRPHGRGIATPSDLRAADLIAADVLRYGDTYIELAIAVPEESYLILADLSYPGWAATADGSPVPIIVADDMFRAVRLAAGAHHIAYLYRPPVDPRRWLDLP